MLRLTLSSWPFHPASVSLIALMSDLCNDLYLRAPRVLCVLAQPFSVGAKTVDGTKGGNPRRMDVTKACAFNTR